MNNLIQQKFIWLLGILGIFSLTGMPVIAGIAVIVNPAIAITSANPSEIKALFLGKTKTIGGNAVMPVEQKAGATRDSFNSKVLKKSNRHLKAYWTKLLFSGKGTPPKIMDNDAAVKAHVAGSATAIGYIDSTAIDGSVKVILKIE